jgi:hypothetical protein
MDIKPSRARQRKIYFSRRQKAHFQSNKLSRSKVQPGNTDEIKQVSCEPRGLIIRLAAGDAQ